MTSALLPHALGIEFPELKETIHQLKLSSFHFAEKLEMHDDIDRQISLDEMGLS